MSVIRQLFARKSMADLAAQGKANIGLRRTLGTFDLIFLGVGVILGTGVFVVTGQAAATHAGPAVGISFAIAGLAAALAALCYAEMGAMIPVAGSAYTYTYATMGELVAFAIGWTLILEWCVSGALVAVGWSGYLNAFISSTTGLALPARWLSAPIAWDTAAGNFVFTDCYANVPAMLFVAVVAAVLMRGVRLSARFNALAVAAKVLAIGLFIYFGYRAMKIEYLTPFVPPNAGSFGRFGLSGVMQGASMVYLSFIGFDAVSTAAQEARNPSRDIPLGTLIPVFVCTGLYVIVGTVLTGLVPYDSLAVAHPLALGIRAAGKPWLEWVVAGGAVIGLSSCMLGALLAMPRIFMSMSHDGLLPPALGRVHKHWGTPHVATLVTAFFMAAMAGTLPIAVLGEMSSIGTMFAFLLVSLGVMLLRIRQPELPRRFRVPGGPYFIPLASCLVSLALMVTATGHTLIRLGIWMLLGGVVYGAYGVRHSKLAASRRVVANTHGNTRRVA